MRLAFLCTILFSVPLLGQTSGELAQHFAGCYQMRIVSAPANDKESLPPRFQLLAQPLSRSVAEFAIRAFVPEAPQWTLSSWRPRNRQRLEITWSQGLGGYRVKLTEKDGNLLGSAKFWCDTRCAFKTPKLAVEARRVECEPGTAEP